VSTSPPVPPSSPAAAAAAPPTLDRPGFGLAFSLTWLSYATYYLGRKGISVARTAIEGAFGERALWGVETGYLAMYAVGQFLCGGIGDRTGARRLIGFGMLASAAACVGFGCSSLAALFLVAMMINGIAQSSGWPGNVKAMAEWVPSSQRGRTMGLWTTCYQVGGIAANFLAARLLKAYGWRGSFIGPGLIIALVGVLVLVFLRKGPLAPASASPAGTPGADEELAEQKREASRRVLRSFTVWCYGASYFCIKLIRYSLLFWLPYYLEKILHYARDDAAYFSTSFEIGGVAGTIVIGLLSDRLKHIPRSVIAATSLVCLAAALFLFLQVGASGRVANFVAMAIVGAFLFGPDALISAAAAQDAGGPLAAAQAAGIINGLGSIGGVLQETVTRGVSRAFGWDALFYVFVALALLSAVGLSPTFQGKGARAAEGT
jgi:OPA family sugar phosphate sensor protein UhpC-like MFS transporter